MSMERIRGGRYTGKKLPRDYFATNEKGPKWYYPTEDFWL